MVPPCGVERRPLICFPVGRIGPNRKPHRGSEKGDTRERGDRFTPLGTDPECNEKEDGARHEQRGYEPDAKDPQACVAACIKDRTRFRIVGPHVYDVPPDQHNERECPKPPHYAAALQVHCLRIHPHSSSHLQEAAAGRNSEAMSRDPLTKPLTWQLEGCIAS